MSSRSHVRILFTKHPLGKQIKHFGSVIPLENDELQLIHFLLEILNLSIIDFVIKLQNFFFKRPRDCEPQKVGKKRRQQPLIEKKQEEQEKRGRVRAQI